MPQKGVPEVAHSPSPHPSPPNPQGKDQESQGIPRPSQPEVKLVRRRFYFQLGSCINRQLQPRFSKQVQQQ